MLLQRVIIVVHFVHLFCSRDLKYQHSFMKIMYVCTHCTGVSTCMCARLKYSPVLTNLYAELQYIPFYFCSFFVYLNSLFPSPLSTEIDKRIITYLHSFYSGMQIEVKSAIHFKISTHSYSWSMLHKKSCLF